jgi:hypothetical protein
MVRVLDVRPEFVRYGGLAAYPTPRHAAADFWRSAAFIARRVLPFSAGCQER